MNLHALRIFSEVARHGSVTRAAEAMLLSQPAVTVQLRNLERDVGFPLLAPRGRGIFLTEAGAMLAEQAERLFALERDIEARVAAYRDGRSGQLRVSATSLPAHYLLPSWIAAYKMEMPDTEWVVTTRNSREAYRDLLLYRSDLAVIGGGEEPPEAIECVPLMEDELWFVVPPGHRMASQTVPLEQLMREPFILQEPGSSVRDKLLALCRERGVPQPKASVQVSGAAGMVRAVSAGYGAVFVSALEVREALERGEVARVFVPDAELRNPIVLCRRKGDALPPAAERFLEWLAGQLPVPFDNPCR